MERTVRPTDAEGPAGPEQQPRANRSVRPASTGLGPGVDFATAGSVALMQEYLGISNFAPHVEHTHTLPRVYIKDYIERETRFYT